MGLKGKPDKVCVGTTQGHSHWEAKVIRGHSECYSPWEPFTYGEIHR